MTSINFKTIFASIILSISIFAGAVFAGAVFVPTMVMAAEDAEVEVICIDTINDDIFCETVENLKAECALTDPENTTEICQDANSANVRQVNGLQVNGLVDASNRAINLTNADDGTPTSRK